MFVYNASMQKTPAQIGKILESAEAVIFDIDGILIDSERHHEQSHRQALSAYGITVDKTFYISHGVSREPYEYYAEAAAENGKILDDRTFQMIRKLKLELYQKLQKKEGVIPLKAGVELARKLSRQKKPLAVASQVLMEEVVHNLWNIGLENVFPIVVAGGDFGLPKKPAPAVYLKAAELLGVLSKNCVAIEDSANGAAAAVAAGMTCLVVPNEYTRSHQFPKDAIVTSFEEVEAALQ